jgi:hypothetical protein
MIFLQKNTAVLSHDGIKERGYYFNLKRTGKL